MGQVPVLDETRIDLDAGHGTVNVTRDKMQKAGLRSATSIRLSSPEGLFLSWVA